MTRIDLTQGWSFAESPSLPETASLADMPPPASLWTPIPVPGDVNAVLVAEKRMPDPHFDVNGRSCYHITSKDWWYRLEFHLDKAPGDDTELCFTEVDGVVDAWLDGEPLGMMKNAFREHRFPVGSRLTQGSHTLVLRFRSIDRLLGGPRLDELAGWKGRRAFLRKPQFNFGWDWSLPLPSIGLAGSVWLEAGTSKRFVDLAIQTWTSGRVDFSFEISKAAKKSAAEINLTVKGHGVRLRETVVRDRHKSYLSLQIPHPELWWPNGYGEQALYDYTAELVVGGKVVDRREGRFGIRESAVVENPFRKESGPGFSYEIRVNGQTIFCKGGNWIPLELWPGAVREEQYHWYLRKAKEANFNMLRVWGGGIYEREAFHRLCDEMGIMVWQDFMFASTGYPVDALRHEIIAEALCQIRRLRNHPSIVLWCGCNEDIESWNYNASHPDLMPSAGAGAAATQADSGVYSEVEADWEIDRVKDDPQIYTMILRGLVGRHGLGVPYIESSPASRDDAGNLPESGNCHISCWKYSLFEDRAHPENFRRHFEKVCAFDSEFCIQGPPSAATMKRFLAPENHWPPNDAWIYHIQRGHANLPHHEQTMLIAGGIFGAMDSLETYVKHGQATHLEQMRAEFESARRDRPDNGGTMMWMYNDCWPTANWSIIDYFREAKPSYYAAKRACAPRLPIMMERGGKVEFFFGNDTLKPCVVDLAWGERSLSGKTIWARKKKLRVPANATPRFDAVPLGRIGKSNTLFIDARMDGQALAPVTYFAHGWKDLPWADPQARFDLGKWKRLGDSFIATAEIHTKSYARLLHLRPRLPLEGLWFSDNFFDLPAGALARVKIEGPRKMKADELELGHWMTVWK